MDSIDRLLSRAWRRVALQRAVRFVGIGLTVGMAAVVALRLVSSVAWQPAEPGAWWLVLLIAGGVGAALAVVWSVLTAERGDALARLVDDRAQLREAISTARCVAGADDAWSRAALAQAEHTASGVDLRRSMPIEPPRAWGVPVVAVLAAAAALLLPPPDLRGWFDTETETDATIQQVAQAQAEVDEARAELRAEAERLGLDVSFTGEDGTGEVGAPDQMTPDAIRAAAVKQLTNLSDQLAEKMSTPEQQTREALEKSLNKLRQPGPGLAQDLARAMARGEFDKAQQAIKKLTEQIASDELDAAQREQLQQQLAQLSEQLSDLSNERRESEQALQQAGLSEADAQRLARDPEALRQALEQMQNLTEAQKQALLNQIQSACEAGRCNSEMANALSQMASAMSQGASAGQLAAAAESLSGQLSQMEMLSAEMASMQAMLSKTQSQSMRIGQGACNNPSMMQSSQSGQFGRFAGKGDGNAAPVDEVQARTFAARGAVENATDGPIIGSRLVYEGQVRGESRAEFSAAAASASSQAADAIESMRVPRAYERAVMRYFGALEQRADNPDGGEANNTQQDE